MANDAFLDAAIDILRTSLNELQSCIADVTVDGLNWRPTAEDSNSLAAISVHALSSTRSWLSVAVGRQLPDRARSSEFEAVIADPEALKDFVASISDESLALLTSAAGFDGSATRRTHERPDPTLPTEVPAAWALLHSLDHLREHVGQILLTKQLWLDRPQSG
jgi:hypothetical protein